jgi:hypothetical protein
MSGNFIEEYGSWNVGKVVVYGDFKLFPNFDREIIP